jgi:hypothetical protein
MKTTHRITLFAVVLSLASSLALPAAEIVAGPKGGRLFSATPNPAEFFVTPDRKVEIIFYDATRQAIAPGTQEVTVTAEAPDGKKSLTLEKTATGFVSQEALPAGEPYRVVVQIRPAAGARPQNFRVDLNLAHCAECNHAEYACTCEGH